MGIMEKYGAAIFEVLFFAVLAGVSVAVISLFGGKKRFLS